MYSLDETDACAGMNYETFGIHTITSGQWVAPEVVLLTNQRFLMAQPVSCVTLEGHRGADGQVMA